VRHDPYEAELMPTITGWMDDATRAELERLEAAFEAPGDVRTTCRAFFELLLRGYYYLHDPSSSPPRVRVDVCTGPEDALRNMWLVNMATMRSLGEYDWREDFRALRVPTLLVAGVREIFPSRTCTSGARPFPTLAWCCSTAPATSRTSSSRRPSSKRFWASCGRSCRLTRNRHRAG
jgi:hypothetical protein